jgi:hypothetical protein
MIKAAEKNGTKGKIFITAPAAHGAQVVSADPPFSIGSLNYTGQEG